MVEESHESGVGFECSEQSIARLEGVFGCTRLDAQQRGQIELVVFVQESCRCESPRVGSIASVNCLTPLLFRNSPGGHSCVALLFGNDIGSDGSFALFLSLVRTSGRLVSVLRGKL